MIEYNKTYEIIKNGPPEERLNLLHHLPENGLKESAGSMLHSSNPLMALLAFGSLLPSYCHGNNCETGAVLARVLYDFGKELFKSGKYPDLYLMTVTGFAGDYINALLYTARYQEGYEFIESEILFWKGYEKDSGLLDSNDRKGFLNNLKSILISEINILIQLNKIDEAWDLAFNQPERVEGNWSSDIELARLRRNLKQIRSDSGQLDLNADERKKEAEKNQEASEDGMYQVLKSMMNDIGMDPGLVENLQSGSKIDPYTKSGFQQLENVLSRGESFLRKDSNELNEISVRQQIRRASGIFVDNQPTREQISKSKDILEKSLQEAKQLQNTELINDAYYSLYLCHSRLGNSSEAADHLILLRNNLEKIREGISNPMERGGVFQKYPYLFYALVEHLFKAGRYEDVFDAIEGSKGRVIVDVLEQQSGNAVKGFETQNIREKLQPVLSKENAHYVTFHVDDDCSYVAVFTKTGAIYCDKISKGKTDFEKWYKKALQQPMNWNIAFIRTDIIRELYPFVSLIEKLIQKDIIQKQDHICYSADHLLYLFPLHYLKIGSKSLIELHSVSRIHNAGHLLHVLSEPPFHPARCLALDVPSIDDMNKTGTPEKFAASSLLLEKSGFVNVQRLQGIEADMENLFAKLSDTDMVHFSTHGVFAGNKNPYHHSGLLIAYNKQLPKLHITDPDYAYNKDGKHLLNPERLLKSGEFGLKRTHISMQACVGGYAREGIGGDALGLEWAFFQKGAGSMITSFWNVEIGNANAFFRLFYEAWLKKGMRKSEAHRSALMQLKGDPVKPGVPPEYLWAGFGLIGDWR